MNNSILYEVHNGIYVNLTNRCPCACVFCLRNTTDTVGRSDRLWLEKEIAAFVKEKYNKPTRINTNGLGNLVNGRDIAPELKGLIDVVSISLNTPNKERYLEEVRPCFGEPSFDAMLSFAKECVKYVKKVVLSTVDTTLTKEEERECAAIAASIGAVYRIRPFE